MKRFRLLMFLRLALPRRRMSPMHTNRKALRRDRGFLLTSRQRVVDSAIMRQFYDRTKDFSRAFRAYAVVCLIILQAIAVVFAPLGRSHVHSDIPGVSEAIASPLCGIDDAQGDPVHSTHEQECMICASGGRAHCGEALALLAVVVVVIASDAEESSPAFVAQDTPSLASSRFRIPLSRGPPASLS